MKQGTVIVVKEAFAFKNSNARGRSVEARLGDRFIVTRPEINNKTNVVIDRYNKAHINQGYLFDIETIKKYFFLEDEKHTCPKCKGSGKMKFTISTVNGNDSTKTENEMTCFYCAGSGSLNNDRMIRHIDEQNWYNNAWCKCGNHSGKVTYHKDTKKAKHHWTCDDCGKIQQWG